ncbi:MAG: DNA replication/repair protein RecF [Firmicutes bacterium]|nr:DNA replication/repair protein RecF [Bacillota bacterium]
MYIESLKLKNYRNIEDLEITPHKKTSVLFGDNAQGKTNILESVYYCATGRSHRTSNDKEIVMFDKDAAFIRLSVRDDYGRLDRIDISIKSSGKKGIGINGMAVKRIGELLGTLNVVIFCPENLQLIKSGPGERRRFMDMEMCQIDKVYYYNLKQYYKVLKQRNNLLKKIKKPDDTLDIWDLQLAEYGSNLMEQRADFIEKISGIASGIHKKITADKEELKIEYNPNVSKKDFYKKLSQNREKDILYGNTSVGVHKDDIIFYINGVNARDYGSQGQQRTACLSTKMAEIELIKQEKNHYPVLLLDDVLSELDKKRQEYLINNIADVQTIVTSTGVDENIKNICKDGSIFYVEAGKVKNGE